MLPPFFHTRIPVQGCGVPVFTLSCLCRTGMSDEELVRLLPPDKFADIVAYRLTCDDAEEVQRAKQLEKYGGLPSGIVM